MWFFAFEVFFDSSSKRIPFTQRRECYAVAAQVLILCECEAAR